MPRLFSTTFKVKQYDRWEYEYQGIKYYIIETDIVDAYVNYINFENTIDLINDIETNINKVDIILTDINKFKNYLNKLNLLKLLISKLDNELTPYLVEF